MKTAPLDATALSCRAGPPTIVAQPTSLLKRPPDASPCRRRWTAGSGGGAALAVVAGTSCIVPFRPDARAALGAASPTAPAGDDSELAPPLARATRAAPADPSVARSIRVSAGTAAPPGATGERGPRCPPPELPLRSQEKPAAGRRAADAVHPSRSVCAHGTTTVRCAVSGRGVPSVPLASPSLAAPSEAARPVSGRTWTVCVSRRLRRHALAAPGDHTRPGRRAASRPERTAHPDRGRTTTPLRKRLKRVPGATSMPSRARGKLATHGCTR